MNREMLDALLAVGGLYAASRVFVVLLKSSKKVGFMLACDLLQEAIKTHPFQAVRVPGMPVLIPEVAVIELVKAMKEKYKKDGAPGDPPRAAGV